MRRILDTFKKEKAYKQFLKAYLSRKGEVFPMLISGLTEGAACAFYASIIEDLRKEDKTALCLLPSEKDVAHLAATLEDYGIRVSTYTLRDMVFQNITAFSRRIACEN